MLLGTPVEGIYLAARTLLEPGDEVIVLTPAYDALVNLFEHIAGADRVRRWAFRPDGPRWSLELDDLRGLITAKTKLIVVNFPHNPTGYLPSAEWQRELAATGGGTRTVAVLRRDVRRPGSFRHAADPVDGRCERSRGRPVGSFQDPRPARLALRLAGRAGPGPARRHHELEVLHQHLSAGADRVPGDCRAAGGRYAQAAQHRAHRT